MDYLKLKTELDNDPKGLGYSGKTDREAADLLNALGLSHEEVDNDVLEAYKILDATDPTEWAALSAVEKERYQLLISAGRLNVKSENVKSAFGKMFGLGTVTRAALLALTKRDASRAEILFGQGVSLLDVHKARRL